MARRRNTRVGFGLGGSSWISFGRSGPRVGGRIGRVRVSTGRSGTRLSARDGKAFVTTWMPNDRRPRPVKPRTSRAGFWTVLLILFIIGEVAHLTGHG